jgi:ketosteroid isomerase-like protein
VAGNAQRVHDALRDYNAGGLRALSDGWWADDIVWHDLPDLPDPVLSRGREAVEARIREIELSGQFHFVVQDVEERGDVTLAEIELVGAGTQSGAEFVGRLFQASRWRDGRVVELHTFGDRPSAEAAFKSLSGA